MDQQDYKKLYQKMLPKGPVWGQEKSNVSATLAEAISSFLYFLHGRIEKASSEMFAQSCDETLVDWENMLDRYTTGYNTTQADAVATLMRYVGQAERMEYGTSAAGGSGVNADSVSLIADAFKFFGYDEETVRVVKKTSAYSGGTTLYTDAECASHEFLLISILQAQPLM